MEGKLITLETFTALGRTLHSFEVFAYDFLLCGSAEIYDGMIGLDFIKNTRHEINLKHNYIELID